MIGVVVSRLVAQSASPGFFKSLGVSLLVMSSLVAMVGGVGRLRADVPPTLDGEELTLMVEARWPRHFAWKRDAARTDRLVLR